MVFAFVLAALTLTGHVAVGHVLVLAALLGTVNAVDSPTRQSFVPEMVGRENLASAIAFNTTMVTGASFVGPAIGGVLVEVLGEGWCFLVNGASFLAVIAGLLAMRDLPPPTSGPARESMGARLHEGFRFAATHEGVRALLLLLALTVSAGLSFFTLMPIVASTLLHGDSRTLGLLMGTLQVSAPSWSASSSRRVAAPVPIAPSPLPSRCSACFSCSSRRPDLSGSRSPS